MELGDEDGDDAGEIELGAHCAPTESAVEGLFEELAAPAAPAPSQASGGNDSCEFAFDDECDEPGIGTGACPAGTDAADC